MMPDEALIKVKNVSKKYCRSLKRSMLYGIQDIALDSFGIRSEPERLRRDEFWAVSDVSFEVKHGECLGIIGANGAGKSTLLRLLSGIYPPDKGKIRVRGRVGSLIEIGAGFHPMLTGRENIYINGSIMELSIKSIDKKFDAIVDFSAIGDFLDTPVKYYSSGMYVRLGYSIAVHSEPDLLLVDEVLAVGDVSFQRKCLQHMRNYLSNGGSIVLVAHNMHLIQSICTHALVIEGGRPLYHGEVKSAIEAYMDSMAHEQLSNRPKPPNSVQVEVGHCLIELGVPSFEPLRIHPGGKVRVILPYRISTDLDQVTWGFSIWNQDQTVRITTATSSWDGKLVDLKRGEGTLICEIASLPLAPGHYVVKAGVYDPNTSWPIVRSGWDDLPAELIVESAGDEASVRRRITGDIVHIDNLGWQ